MNSPKEKESTLIKTLKDLINKLTTKNTKEIQHEEQKFMMIFVKNLVFSVVKKN